MSGPPSRGAGPSGPSVVLATGDRRRRRPDPAPLTPSSLLKALARLGIRPAALPRRTQLAWTLGVSAVLTAALWLDSAASPFALDQAPAVTTAAFFGAVVSALELLAGWIAAAAEVTAAAVWVFVQWLAATTAAFLVSTGAMFARIWDALRIVWSDVLKPALVWLDAKVKVLQAWLKDTFRPVFDFLQDVRERLRAFYDTFVRPVTDTIEFIRQVNRVLLTFHIDVLQKLDRVLQQVEQRIDEPFLWIYQQLNTITNWVNRIVTLDGLFQRITLVKSLAHYAPSWIAGFYNSQINATELGAKKRAIEGVPVTQDVTKPGEDLGRFYRGESSDLDADVADCLTFWQEAAGVTAPARARI